MIPTLDQIKAIGITKNISRLNNISYTPGALPNESVNLYESIKVVIEELMTIDTSLIDDLILLTGLSEHSQNLGTFTGNIITDNTSIKTALQELETAIGNLGSVKQRVQVTSFQNNWISWTQGPLHFDVYYIKEGTKVTLEGVVLQGTDNTTVFTLPAGFRPFNNKVFSTSGYSSTISPYNVYIEASTGNVVISSSPTGTGTITDRVSLDNISFYIN